MKLAIIIIMNWPKLVFQILRQFWSNIKQSTKLALEKRYEWDLKMLGYSAEEYLHGLNL